MIDYGDYKVTKKPNNVIKLRGFNESAALNKSSFKKYKPKSKDYYIRDKKLEGFYIRVYPSGKKTYGIYSRKGGVGRKVSISIGNCDYVEFEDAKNSAKDWLYLLRQGIHPKEKIKEESLKDKTLLDLVKEFVELRDLELKSFTKQDYVRRIELQMPTLCNKRIIEITKDDVVDWYRNSKKNRSSVLAMGYAKKVFDVAVADNYLETNIFTHAKTKIGKLPSIRKRETHITQNQLYNFVGSLYQVAPKLSVTMRDYIFFLFITGKRLTESAELTWNNVNYKNGTITLLKTKSGKVDVIPITPYLYLLLKFREGLKHKKIISLSKHPIYVFPNSRGTGPIKDPRKALKKINKVADLGFEITPHDLRRTFGTATKEINLSNEDTAVLLNHAKNDVTENYIMRSLEYKRNNLQKVQQYLDNFSGGGLGRIAVDWYKGHPNIAVDQEVKELEINKEKELSKYLFANEGPDDQEKAWHNSFKIF